MWGNMGDYSAYSVNRLRRREYDFPTPSGSKDALCKSLYSNMETIAKWEPDVRGGVFNMEFSPEGRVMVAACEKKSILVFDPLNQNKIHEVSNAHADCVNCVKFLDSRMFATCSDDHSVALWDIRNLKNKIRTLQGHSSWVKNIEYSVKDNLLVTLELDGNIYIWDINSDMEWSLMYQCVFHSTGLMRCRLSPDASQMVMCTTGGLIIIVHNLNLSTLAKDFYGFKPNLYRLMQTSGQCMPVALSYDHLFDHDRKENRLELISDFPDGNDAEVISSLQIHPQGWCALSRNTSHDDTSEWTCIHDIQAYGESSYKSVRDNTPSPTHRTAKVKPTSQQQRQINVESPTTITRVRQSSNELPRYRRVLRSTQSSPQTRSVSPQPSSLGNNNANNTQRPAFGVMNDVWEASVPVDNHRTFQEMIRRGQRGRTYYMQRIMGINTGIISQSEITAVDAERTNEESDSIPWSVFNERDRPSSSGSTVPMTTEDNSESEENGGSSYIRQNKPRLLYYTQETNQAKGFIKELCFSSDGRLICSPFGYGIRLLAFNNECSELSDCINETDTPSQLIEVSQKIAHRDLVVSSKFSPTHCLFVTGCLSGTIAWYQPRV